MTGFGRGAATASGLRAEVGIGSVNRKQLDIVVSLPRALSSLEPRVHEAVGSSVSRGRISVEITVRDAGAGRAVSATVDEALARSYVAGIRRVAKRLGLPDDLSASSMLSLPGVVRVEQGADDAERSWPVIEKALGAALKNLVAMRAREGAALAKDLLARVRSLESLTDNIRGQFPASAERYRRNLAERVRGLQEDVTIPQDRIDREVVMFAERSDITEELTRLRSHAEQAISLVRGREPAGKALDFLAQELSREINTIGSKANDAGIARCVVLFKTELDRFREQVQNIE